MELPLPPPAESEALDALVRPTEPCPTQHRQSSILHGTPPGSDARARLAFQSPSTPVTIPSLYSPQPCAFLLIGAGLASRSEGPWMSGSGIQEQQAVKSCSRDPCLRAGSWSDDLRQPSCAPD